jgi:hypothetical protein
MPSTLEEPRTPGLPVVKRQRIGDKFRGMVIDLPTQRDVQKRDPMTGVNAPVIKANGKPRQELVVYAMALPGTTTPAGIGDVTAVPAPGDHVRLILRGSSFANWIEQKNKLGTLQTGDVIELEVDHAQVYNADGDPVGDKITDQAVADRVPRGQTLGFYGPLTLRRADGTETDWALKADAAYQARKAAAHTPTALVDDFEEPF